MGYRLWAETVAADSHITLHLLGAGGAFTRIYGTTCSVLTLRDGERWLIDCGRQAPDQLHAAGIEWHDIFGQLVTHVHGDHTYGLEDFAFSRFFYEKHGVGAVRSGGPRPKLICHGAVEEELWESLRSSLRYVPLPAPPKSGTLQTYFETVPAHATEPARDNPWNHAESFAAGSLRVRATETVHVPGKPSTALTIEVGEDKVAWWSGDSTVDAAMLTELEPRATVFFHDCTFFEYPGQVHGSFAALEQLPEAVRRKVVLMHHEDDLEANRKRAESLGFRIAVPGQTYDLVTGQLIPTLAD